MLSYIDIIGAGFVPNVPGLYGNCRVYYDGSVVHHVGLLYQEWPSHPEPAAPPPEPIPEPEPELPPESEPAPQVPAEPGPAQDQPQEVVPPSEPAVQQSLGG